MPTIELGERVMVSGYLMGSVVGAGCDHYPAGDDIASYSYYWVRIDGGQPMRVPEGEVRRLLRVFSVN